MKLGDPGRLNAVAAGLLVHIVDSSNNRRYLVDTGASYSILPHKSPLPATGPKLFGPGGQPIRCWGERAVNLTFQERAFSWKFLLADVAFPIIGVDFLRFHNLSVDAAGDRLTDRDGKSYPTLAQPSPPTASVLCGYVQPYRPAAAVIAGPANAGPASAGPASAGPASAGPASAGPASAGPDSRSSPRAAAGRQDRYRKLLDEFPAVECVSKRLPPVSHDVVHHIVTTGPPIASKFRKLDGEKLAAAKAEFKQLEEDGMSSGPLLHGPVLCTW